MHETRAIIEKFHEIFDSGRYNVTVIYIFKFGSRLIGSQVLKTYFLRAHCRPIAGIACPYFPSS